MEGIVDVFVPPKFCFHVCVSENPLFRVELLAVGSEQTAVERDGRKEGDLRWSLPGFEDVGQRGGEETNTWAHGNAITDICTWGFYREVER